jgi:hypothetical protein
MGRRDGLHTTTEKMIHETEAWLTYEAWKVICCSNYMISHVKYAFGLPSDKLVTVPNGVNIHNYDGEEDLRDFLRKFALPEEKSFSSSISGFKKCMIGKKSHSKPNISTKAF